MNKSWLKTKTLSILWLFFLGYLAFLSNLGDTGLVDETEPLFAEAARQITVTGDWITPYFNGETRFDKPILIYWLMAICYQILGVNEWAVRLPSALAAIALMIACFYTLKYYHSELSAYLGAGIIAFNPLNLVWGRTGVSDMLLSACLGIGLLCFFWGYVETEKEWTRDQIPQPAASPFLRGRGGISPFWDFGNWSNFPNSYYLSFYILLALAVLTKGPIGVVLPVLIITTFLLYLGKFRQVLSEMGIIWGGIIFLIITLPWYILVILKNGEQFINAFFGYHNFERFTSVVNHHAAPWYFYFLIILFAFAPWSIYLPIAIKRLALNKRKFWLLQTRHNQLSLFAFFWFAGIFIFFTIAITKLPSYVVPLVPAASILVVNLCSENKYYRGLLISIIINILLLLILALGLLLLPQLLGEDQGIVNFRELINQSSLLGLGAFIWIITAVIIFITLIKKITWRWTLLINLLGFIAFLIFVLTPGLFLVDQYRQLPLRQIAETIVKIQKPNEELLMIGFKKPSLVFYTQEKVHFFMDNNGVIDYLKETANNLPHTVLIVSYLQDIGNLPLKSNSYQNIENQGVYTLLRVDKEKIVN